MQEEQIQKNIQSGSKRTAENYFERTLISFDQSRDEFMDTENTKTLQHGNMGIFQIKEESFQRIQNHSSINQKTTGLHSLEDCKSYPNSKIQSNEICEVSIIRGQDPECKCARTYECKDSFSKHLQILDLHQHTLSDEGIFILRENKDIWKDLVNLNLSENRIGKIGAKCLSASFTSANIKKLDLSRNPLGNEGIKYIAEGTCWSQLEIFILNRVSLDSYGAKSLVENESWENIKELHLQDNPMVGDQGAIWLSSSLQWKKLRKLFLFNSNVGDLGIKFLKRRANLSWQISESKRAKVSSGSKKLNYRIAGDVSADDFTHTASTRRKNHSTFNLNYEIRTRGAGNQAEETGETKNYSLLGLLDKISQYKMRIQNDNRYEDELNLYVEMLGKLSINPKFIDSEPAELTFCVKKHFFGSESTLRSLLLTGEAGIGKTLFCKYLQRAMLFEWEVPLLESEERVWLPIFVSLSGANRLKPFSSSGVISVPEILKEELNLTESEIKLLQERNIEMYKQIPRLLFIVDDYDTVLQKLSPENRMNSVDFCIDNNFYTSSGFGAGWEHSKIIIACRKEAVSNFAHNKLLFGPVDKLTRMPIPSTFAELELRPFDDAQITSYLKKYAVLKNPKLPIEDDEFNLSSKLESWRVVRNYEKLIDHYGVRELVRIPMMLFIAADVLPNIASISGEKKLESEGIENSTWSEIRVENDQQNWTRNRLYQLYTNKAINTTVTRLLSAKSQLHEKQQKEKKQSFLIEKIKKELQNFALISCGYLSNPAIIIETMQTETKVNHSLLAFCPLVKFKNIDSANEAAVFTHKSLQEYILASIIEEEICKDADNLLYSANAILNQKFLTNGSISSSVLQFLVDAVIDNKIPTTALIKLVRRSSIPDFQPSEKISELEVSRPEGNRGVRCDIQPGQAKHLFSVAAANAITILNASGFNFSRLDLSQISIPGANLKYGIFEGTNFTGADLQGVDFSGAWLKDTVFVGAAMSEVKFGVIPPLTLDKEAYCLAQSPNGKYLVVGVYSEIIVFERHTRPETHFKEMKRLKSHGKNISCSFSANGKLLITGGDDKTVRIWAFETGERLTVLKGHDESVTKCQISQGNRSLLSAEGNRAVSKWDLSDGKWRCSFEIKAKDITNCSFVPNNGNLLFLGTKSFGYVLFESERGRYIRKGLKIDEDLKVISSSLSFDGKQIVTGYDDGAINTLDIIRNHSNKFLEHYLDTGAQNVNASFCFMDNRIISTNDHTLQLQTATGDHVELHELPAQITHYSIDPINHHQLVGILENKIICFLESSKQKSILRIKGANQRGLNLTGTNIDGSFGLSEENARTFEQEGDYRGLGSKNIQELICDNRKFSPRWRKTMKIDLTNRSLGTQAAIIIGRNTQWTNLKSLNLSKNYLTDANFIQIANNKTWKGLEELILNSNQITERGAAAIVENSCWNNLKKLHLRSNLIDNFGARALGTNLTWEYLEDLDLSQNRIEDVGAATIGCNNSWKYLIKLNLSSNMIGDRGVAIISLNTTWNHLETLELANNRIGDAGAAAIGDNTRWAKLKLLSLETNQIGNVGASTIVKNKTWTSLEELYLYNNEFSLKLRPNKAWTKMKVMVYAFEIEEVRRALLEEDIEEINLSFQDITNADAVVIGRSICWHNLKVLDLRENDIGDEGAVAIGKNTTWNNLKQLLLGDNLIKDEGAISIGLNTTWASLEILDLEGNRFGDKGAAMIGKNRTWSKLIRLNLSSNEIGDEGALSIGSNTTWTKLEVLCLQQNLIKHQGAKAIGQNIQWVNLTKLSLSKNIIRDKGVIEIGRNRVWTELEELLLDDNVIGNDGAKALGENTTWRNLKVLSLANNKIGDEGAISIGSNKTWVDLEHLNLQENKVGEKGAAALKSNSAWKNLSWLNYDQKYRW